MVLQAGGVRRLLGADPPREREREALAGIEETGRQAVGELHRMLGILRKSEPDLAPSPSLRRVDELVEQVRSAGLDTTLDVQGEPADLAPGVDMSAYRIVQEALTNALRYAPGSTVGVTVTYGRDLQLVVADDGARVNGKAPATPGSGHGIVGMRERAALFGGELDAGPAAGGGFLRPCEASAVSIRVVVADDQALVRAGLKMVLEAERRHRGRRRGRRRRAGARGRAPHEARRRPDGHPDAGARRPRGARGGCSRRDDAPKVVVLTTFDEEEYLYEALRAGTSGFLLKVSPPERLIGAVRTVAAGNALIDPAVTQRVIEAFGRRAATKPPPPGARRAHRARAGGAGTAGPRPLQPGDRGRADRRRRDGQDPRRRGS